MGSFFSSYTLPATVVCQFICFNRHIKTQNLKICFCSLSDNDLNVRGQLFDFDGSIKSWECLKRPVFA